MSMESFVDWIQSWDFMAILYSLIATFIGLFLLQWAGVLRRFQQKRKRRQAVKKYRASLADECGLLTVVGRRKGFRLEEVYVPLDTATSDLMQRTDDEKGDTIRGASSYVLVGGPGAGKSTTVKHMLLQQLERDGSLPIFLRLRDYVGFDSLEQYITHKLQAADFADPLELMHALLRSSRTLCVLDGLDEVRPQLREKAIADVNSLYHKYFVDNNRLIVTCRKEAYRRILLDIPIIMEVRPLTDEQIQRFAAKWPLGFPSGKTADTFWRDLTATPRIHELTRSPLLLVGGLMQYTESNLGIPEERFEYLGRIARWLTVEWATAQGHPPDQYLQVYDRLLARLAYHLHTEEKSDLDRAEAERLFHDWLPSFGREDASASEVIDALATRTGILVTDDRNSLVFAQFGLQEYFASLEVMPRVGPEKLAALEPREWWREVILLAVAQERDPTPVLIALFEQAPLMAAAATAECPTPSTDIQDKAVGACLAGIDSGNKEAGSAVVPLLRKVQGKTERLLCAAMGKRLNEGGATASVVGIALATAGTECATNTLAKHPEIWDQCLKEAGYLSTSFENMLVDWIEKGTDFQSRKASELIAARLSTDRLRQLLDLIPSLDPSRSECLAALILDHCGDVFEPQNVFLPEVPISVAARCSAFIRDRDRYLSSRIENAMSHAKLRGVAGVMWRHRYLRGSFEPAGLVDTCLFMEDRTGSRMSERGMSKALHYTVLWGRKRKQFAIWALSAGAVGAACAPFSWNIVAVLGCVLCATLFCGTGHVSLPLSQRRISLPRGMNLAVMWALIASGTLAGFLSESRTSLWLPDLLTMFAACLLSVAGSLLAVSLAMRHYTIDWSNRGPRVEVISAPPTMFFSAVYPVLFSVALVAACIVIFFYPELVIVVRYIAVSTACVFLAWIVLAVFRLNRCSRCVARAAATARKRVERIIEEKS